MSYYPERRSQSYPGQYSRQGNRSGLTMWKIRLLIAGAIVLFSAVSYLSTSSINPITDEKQRVAMTQDQEIEMGRNAAIEMVQQFGGLSPDQRSANQVEMVGRRLESALYQRLQRVGKSIPYPFDFHLLADRNTINAFALPGGQVFITEALFNRMTREGQLAGVLGHEMGHVLERHGAQQMSKGSLMQGIMGAVGVGSGDINTARATGALLDVISKGYGRQAELESDRWGVELMTLAGYDPHHMLEVMDILKDATAGGSPPEFLSTHPKPENRAKYISEVIAERFPEGLPPGLR